MPNLVTEISLCLDQIQRAVRQSQKVLEESRETRPSLPATEPREDAKSGSDSSAPIRGHVERPSPLLYASLLLTPEQTLAILSDYFRSISRVMQGVLMETEIDSSMLRLTLRWPMPSTSTTPVGGLGVASHE